MDVYTFHIRELFSSNLWFLMFTSHNLRACYTKQSMSHIKNDLMKICFGCITFFSIYYG